MGFDTSRATLAAGTLLNDSRIVQVPASPAGELQTSMACVLPLGSAEA